MTPSSLSEVKRSPRVTLVFLRISLLIALTDVSKILLGALIKHLDTHSDVRKFECDECGKQFTRKEHLTSHQISRHSDQRPFQCEICGRDFARSASLRIHLVTHSKEKSAVSLTFQSISADA